MTVYIATWQHYENFMVLDVFSDFGAAIQCCHAEADKGDLSSNPGNEPIIAVIAMPDGQAIWHGKIHPDNNEIGYFVYERIVK